MQYEYRFHEKGFSLKGQAEAGHIYLDIGNALVPGIIDHHSGGGYDCTAAALVDENNRALIDVLKGNDKIVIHTHRYPDTDALISICLLRYYLKNGEFPADSDKIVEFVSKVDRGDIKIKDDGAFTLYKLICCLGDGFRDEKVIERYLYLIDTAIDKYGDGFSFMDGDILEHLKKSGIGELEDFELKKKEIDDDYDRYRSDKEKICIEKNIRLPNKDRYTIGETDVKALIWVKQPTCEFNRLWARGDGYVVTVVPQSAAKTYSFLGKAHDCTDTIISIPPEYADKYSLRPLAYLLEEYEQEKEFRVLGAGNNKRDHSRPRGKKNDGNRFFEKPWSLTSDPWYFTEDETLVQSPYTGSLLTTEEVIKVVETFGECHVKECRMDDVRTCMNVLVPFTYTPSNHGAVLSRLVGSGWDVIDDDKIEDENLSWFRKDKRYISSFIQEYKFPTDRNKRRFHILRKSSLGDIVKRADECDKCPQNNRGCTFDEGNEGGQYAFDEKGYILLFEYGAGIVILTQSSVSSGSDKRFASLEIDRLNGRQNALHDHFIKHPIFGGVFKSDLLYYLAPHFYTSIEVSSECLNMPNSLIPQYAEQICDVFEDDTGTSAIDKVNDHIVLASSRKGVALIIATATDEFNENVTSKDPLNKVQYDYLKRFNGDWFFMYLIALQQRYSLVEIKRSFTSFSGANTRKAAQKVKQLRETLISFYATSYFTTATDDKLGDKIYSTWHDALMIKDLKTDIMEQINQHDENQSKKLTSFLEKVSVCVIAIALFEALVNAEQVSTWVLSLSAEFLRAMLSIVVACIVIYCGVVGVWLRLRK